MKYLILSIFMSASLTVGAQFITNTGVQLWNSTRLTTNGAWTNAEGTHILNHGFIRTSNDFVNLGQLDKQSTGSFRLQYTTDHDFQPGGTAIRALTKVGAGDARLTGTIHIKDSLLLISGLLKVLNSGDTVVLAAQAALTSDTGSYVSGGLVARAGVGDFVFPLGKDGHYLPVTLHQVDAKRITASVENAPAGHSAGPGVASLIDFPYAWRVIGSNAADTAGYVEISYPASLPFDPNLIVARQIPGARYAGMGARHIETSPHRVDVVSYSRRLNGLFTVAQGTPGNLEADSLALVAVYQSTGGESWTSRGNWLSTPLGSWHGITVNGQSITAVDLSNNQLAGPIPDAMADILSLEEIDLSGNRITALPDFSANTRITLLDVSDNHLNFDDLEPNASVAGFSYLTQAEIGTAVDTTISVGSSYIFSAFAGGVNSVYNWTRNGAPLAGSTGDTYYLPSINRENMGDYQVEVVNTALPGLVLKSAVMKVLAHASVEGRLFADSDVPARQGEVTLYRIQPGGFLPVQTASVSNDGAFSFDNVVLGDYQLLGMADTVVYPDILPTYYESALFWEEADSVALKENTSGLDILSQKEPGSLSGSGSVLGRLGETNTGGRLKDDVGIPNVSVHLLRVDGSGEEEVLTPVAHTTTDAEGEFMFIHLPNGAYRLNFQYPGYPMDETSVANIDIGPGSIHRTVEANVKDGKISVRALMITGIFQQESYTLEMYPNPASKALMLQFPGVSKSRTVMFSDMQGRKLHAQPVTESKAVISLAHFPPGMYILRVNERGFNVKTLKVQVE